MGRASSGFRIAHLMLFIAITAFLLFLVRMLGYDRTIVGIWIISPFVGAFTQRIRTHRGGIIGGMLGGMAGGLVFFVGMLVRYHVFPVDMGPTVIFVLVTIYSAAIGSAVGAVARVLCYRG